MELLSTEFLHSQVFWTGVAFFVLLGVMGKFVIPAVAAVLDARAAQIKDDLGRATKARDEAEAILAEYEKQMAAARKEAASVVTTARAEAEALASTRMQQVEAELARKAEEARKSIEQAKLQALREVKEEVAQVSVMVAEKLLMDKVDGKAASKLTDAALKAGLN